MFFVFLLFNVLQRLRNQCVSGRTETVRSSMRKLNVDPAHLTQTAYLNSFQGLPYHQYLRVKKDLRTGVRPVCFGEGNY